MEQILVCRGVEWNLLFARVCEGPIGLQRSGWSGIASLRPGWICGISCLLYGGAVGLQMTDRISNFFLNDDGLI